MGEAKRRADAAVGTFNAAWGMKRLNALANRPDIAYQLAPLYTDLDLSAVFENPANVVVFEGAGAMIFAAIPDRAGWYDTHYLFPRSGGAANLEAARKCVQTMFDVHDAAVLCGNTPRSNVAARIISRMLGARPVSAGVDSQGRDCLFYVLERIRWTPRHSSASANNSAMTLKQV